MKKNIVFLFQLALLFITSACLFGGVANPPSSVGESSAQPASEFEAWEKGQLASIQIDAGKAILANYREEAHIQFSGKNEKGASFTLSQDYLVEKDKTQNARREVETDQTPDVYLSGSQETVIVDGFIYIVRKVNNSGLVCEKEAAPADTDHAVYHTAVLQSITPGKLLEQQVRVNGVLADSYEIKNVSLLLNTELKKVSGKVWIARETAYFLKAEGSLEGRVRLDTINGNGSATFRYEIKDHNQVKIQLPALCAYPSENLFPLPTNASEVEKSSIMITFSSSTTRDALKTFFRNELMARGWKVEELPSDSYPLAVRAGYTTPQGVQIAAEIQINAMSAGSYVVITWQAH